MMPATQKDKDIGAMLRNEPMSRHTSWRVGGPADIYFRPESEEALVAFLRDLPADSPIHWTGLGSNLLVRDGGIRGVVINPTKALAALRRLDNDQVEAQAGVPCTVVARACARWRLGPSAFFAGIPGTIGGALVMNAGAFGGETWDNVIQVETINRDGELRVRDKVDFAVGYRHVERPSDEWFTRARFRFSPQPEDSIGQVRDLMNERKEKQPLGLPSCGSVFRNPAVGHAAQLIESCGLKGFQLGGAQVSPKHANFIINTGDASACDVEQLIDHVRSTVSSQCGVELELEVHIVGEYATDER